LLSRMDSSGKLCLNELNLDKAGHRLQRFGRESVTVAARFNRFSSVCVREKF